VAHVDEFRGVPGTAYVIPPEGNQSIRGTWGIIVDHRRGEKGTFWFSLEGVWSSGQNSGMPKTARASGGAVCFYALDRGNACRRVFHKGEEFAAFAAMLEEACERLPMCLAGEEDSSCH